MGAAGAAAREAELSRQHDDRGEAEQQTRGRGLEEQVVGQVAADLDDALGERDDGRHERAVDDEEDGGDAEDRDQVLGPERERPGRLRHVGEHQQQGRRRDRDRVLRGVEGDLLGRLAVDRVGHDAGDQQAGHADGGPAGQHQREREAGRGGDLALGPARVDLQRDELADEGAEGEEGQLRIEELVEGLVARAEDDQRAGSTRRNHEGDVQVECVVPAEHGRGVRFSGVGLRGCPAPTTA